MAPTPSKTRRAGSGSWPGFLSPPSKPNGSKAMMRQGHTTPDEACSRGRGILNPFATVQVGPLPQVLHGGLVLQLAEYAFCVAQRPGLPAQGVYPSGPAVISDPANAHLGAGAAAALESQRICLSNPKCERVLAASPGASLSGPFRPHLFFRLGPLRSI